MPATSNRRVRTAPPKPLLVFDGDCDFCRRWIERWKTVTEGAVEYAPVQEVESRFPEIAREEFERAVQLIETDGTVYSGAEAVYRSLGYNRNRKWMTWSYHRLPGFAAVSRTAYALIAKHRRTASLFTRILWGGDVRQPSYYESRRWFLRSLGGIYLIAFLSLWVQVIGLIGEHGILPIGDYLPAVRGQVGAKAVFYLPTLCWLSSSDAFLHFLCGAGTVVSILLIVGFAPVISLLLLFILYLSLTIAGQTFLSFQWDILLLETGFLAIFFAPLRWHLSRRSDPPVSRVGHFLIKFLLFKLMLMSGVVKLTSGDDSWGWVDGSFHWSALTALDYHYWTQPLPTVFAWWADKQPEWFKQFSVAFCLFIEIVVPFFIWAPRRLRLLACGLLVSLQIGIAITGNYCFFNLLTIVLCLPLIDDSGWLFKERRFPNRRVKPCGVERRITHTSQYQHWAAIAALVITMPINAALIRSAFKPHTRFPTPIRAVYEWVDPFRIVSGYGLFRVMTKTRPEIIVEGSKDGSEWLAYEFRWKPGDVDRAPQWVAPHQPRLDWQMWFAALSSYRHDRWFGNFAARLLENEPTVTGMLVKNPFPNDPPHYVRATLYEYHFTSSSDRKETGAWWKREEQGEYLPEISLRNR